MQRLAIRCLLVLSGTIIHALGASSASAQPVVQLGKAIFQDTRLSNPPGVACATCHSAAAGFTGSNSDINAHGAVMPGAGKGRFVQRKPLSIAYASFSPEGPPKYSQALQAFVGGQFWDGRATDLSDQVHFPLFNPLEMNNVLPDGEANGQRIINQIKNGPYSGLFKEVFGTNVFQLPSADILAGVADAIVSYESSSEVNQFSSKYDRWQQGDPRARLTASELNGLRLFTGSTSGRPGGPAYKNAHCAECHGIPAEGVVGVPDLFSQYCYANIGVPKNPENPYYKEKSVNPAGEKFVDLLLGDYLYPLYGFPSGGPLEKDGLSIDVWGINGAAVVPTVRNVDKRPFPGFVKAYMHNGSLKSLEEVVLFYDQRNVSKRGKVFALPNPNLGKGDSPIFPSPEVSNPASLNNAAGLPGSQGGQVGNLQLSAQERADIVAFLKTLSDGWQPE